MKIKIIELALNSSPEVVEKILSEYEYVHSYPLKYRTADGFIEVVRYFVKPIEKSVKAKATKDDK